MQTQTLGVSVPLGPVHIERLLKRKLKQLRKILTINVATW